MTDNVAVLEGFTEQAYAIPANGAHQELFLLVKPDADFDGRFMAWDTDNQEYIMVNGWLWRIEKTDNFVSQY